MRPRGSKYRKINNSLLNTHDLLLFKYVFMFLFMFCGEVGGRERKKIKRWGERDLPSTKSLSKCL